MNAIVRMRQLPGKFERSWSANYSIAEIAGMATSHGRRLLFARLYLKDISELTYLRQYILNWRDTNTAMWNPPQWKRRLLFKRLLTFAAPNAFLITGSGAFFHRIWLPFSSVWQICSLLRRSPDWRLFGAIYIATLIFFNNKIVYQYRFVIKVRMAFLNCRLFATEGGTTIALITAANRSDCNGSLCIGFQYFVHS